MQLEHLATQYLLDELGKRCQPDVCRPDPLQAIIDHIATHYTPSFAGRVLLKDFATHPELQQYGKKQLGSLLRRVPTILVKNGNGNAVTVYGITPAKTAD